MTISGIHVILIVRYILIKVSTRRIRASTCRKEDAELAQFTDVVKENIFAHELVKIAALVLTI